LLLPLLFLAFAGAVALDVPVADQLVRTAVDTLFRVGQWLGEQFGERLAEAIQRLGSTPAPTPQPAVPPVP